MLNKILSLIPGYLIERGVGIIMASQQRKTTRRAVRDLVEDSLELVRLKVAAGHSLEASIEDVRKDLRKEVRNRLDPILQSFRR